MLCVKCLKDGKLPENEGSREILPRYNIASATAWFGHVSFDAEIATIPLQERNMYYAEK